MINIGDREDEEGIRWSFELCQRDQQRVILKVITFPINEDNGDDDFNDDDDDAGGQWRGEAGLDGGPGHAEHKVHAGTLPRCHPQVDSIHSW